MNKIILIAFFASILTFLLTCWTAVYSVYTAGWTESVCFFALTYFLLQKYAEQRTNGTPIVASIILGRIILEIPIRINDFMGSLFSLFVPVLVIISIILALICFKEKRASVFILSAIIIVLLNSVVHDVWCHFIKQ